jgi:hypothetical protein
MKSQIAATMLSLASFVMAHAGNITINENDANGLDFTYSWANEVGPGFGSGVSATTGPVTVMGKDSFQVLQYLNTAPYLVGLQDLGLYFDFSTLPPGKSLSLIPALQLNFTDMVNPTLSTTGVIIWRDDPSIDVGWWDQPAEEQAVPGDPYAIRVIYNRSNMPPLQIQRQGGNAEVRMPAPPNSMIDVETSEDLKNWTYLASVTSGDSGQVQFTDENAGQSQFRFYRIIPR